MDAFTPGFWENHSEAWSVLSLPLGDQATLFDRDCLLDFMDLLTRGDVRVIFLHHLIAAKLNLLNGADSSAATGFPTATSTVADTIAAADNYIASASIHCDGLDGQKPRGGERGLVTGLKDALQAFNNNFEYASGHRRGAPVACGAYFRMVSRRSGHLTA